MRLMYDRMLFYIIHNTKVTMYNLPICLVQELNKIIFIDRNTLIVVYDYELNVIYLDSYDTSSKKFNKIDVHPIKMRPIVDVIYLKTEKLLIILAQWQFISYLYSLETKILSNLNIPWGTFNIEYLEFGKILICNENKYLVVFDIINNLIINKVDLDIVIKKTITLGNTIALFDNNDIKLIIKLLSNKCITHLYDDNNIVTLGNIIAISKSSGITHIYDNNIATFRNYFLHYTNNKLTFYQNGLVFKQFDIQNITYIAEINDSQCLFIFGNGNISIYDIFY